VVSHRIQPSLQFETAQTGHVKVEDGHAVSSNRPHARKSSAEANVSTANQNDLISRRAARRTESSSSTIMTTDCLSCCGLLATGQGEVEDGPTECAGSR
jgi:hypothetical protein